jgi:AcrR family transcriptional regulator
MSESVLYAHFDSKRAIFEAVLAKLGPQTAVMVLRDANPGMLDDDPPGFVRMLVVRMLVVRMLVVRMLVARVMESWDTAAARQLISLMSHDGLAHDALLAGAIEDVLAWPGSSSAGSRQGASTRAWARPRTSRTP